MFNDYGWCTKAKIEISTADDSSKTHTTHVDVYSTYQLNYASVRTNTESDGWREVNNSRYSIECSYVRTQKGEPLIQGIKNSLQNFLGWGRRSRRWSAPNDFKVAFVLPNNNNATFMVEKKDPYYKLMSQRVTKKNLMTALSRALYRSCFEEDAQTLTIYMFRMIMLPENVSYVLENRTPFWFFDLETREKVEVRLNTQMIDNDKAALEISDGVWGPISVKDLDIFVNYFYHGHTRAKKWAYMSPKKLWKELLGEAPSESQEQLMVEFLCQNRTQDIVENRAKELMNSLTVRYPERIRLVDVGKYTAMLIRGKKADWIIVDSTYKTQIQKVKTYVFIHDDYLHPTDSDRRSTYHTRGGGLSFMGGQLRGPICIDNVHSNSSLGDQYAARGLALLNDNITMKLVNTIGRYVPKELKEDIDKVSRFDIPFADITGKEKDWKVIAN
jgi:hypothetical protein